MSDFRRVTDTFYVSPQITAEAVKLAADQGFRYLIMNRPERETPDQPDTADIVDAAKQAGLTFLHIPITAPPQKADIDATISALQTAGDDKVLAFCRSGTRSVTLWAFAQASLGNASTDSILSNANAAGYDLGAMAGALSALKG